MEPRQEPKDFPADKRETQKGPLQNILQRTLDSVLVAAFLGMVTIGSNLWDRVGTNDNSIDRLERENAKLFDDIKLMKSRQREIELEQRETRANLKNYHPTR